jgi:predicted TIM-barrel fold metal-dependent hydrolase
VDLADLPVIDGHCHPLLPAPWTVSPEEFLELFTEARPSTMESHVSSTGFYQRALHELARRIESEPTVPAVLERRAALGPELASREPTRSRLAALLVDTGYPPEAMPLSEMRSLLTCSIHEIFRVETCAERLLAKGLPWEAFLAAFRREVRAAAQRCVAFKSIIAYRSGLAIRPWTDREAATSYEEALARLAAEGPPRLTQKPLLDTLFALTLEASRETGRPLQVHAGFGDPDIDLLRANPLLLRPILEDRRWGTVRLVVLHMGYPYVREAAFMSAVWPQVHVDLSLALPFLGPGAIAPLVEILSLAPATKLLYGSDLRGLPELYALAADWARDTLAEALGWLGERSGAFDSRAIATRILSENARALYRLD